MNVVIAAGGTAGHVVPALAVADALRADGHDVAFIGGRRAEVELVPAAGYALHPISAEGLSRSDPVRAARAAVKGLLATVQSVTLLRRIRPDVVMGGGGYIAAPVGLAAVALRIPLVLTEADSHLGLANRLLARFAQRICLAFPIAGRDGPRYRVTGRPVPPPMLDRDAARQQLGVGREERCILVFGGSLGAHSINEASISAFARAPFHVIHACGVRDYDALAGRDRGDGYDLRAEIYPFAPALAASDLVVARAGGSIFEITAHGRPAILIPYPHATADHQTANARWMADAGAATIIDDRELTPQLLAARVGELLSDGGRLSAMSRASAALARPDAAAEIATELREAARG